MPDHHRTQLVVFRARAEFDRHRNLAPDSEEAHAKLLDAEVYLDNLQHQAEHLASLTSQNLLIPVDLRKRQRSSSSISEFHETDTDARGSNRKLLEAVRARAGATERRSSSSRTFMRGPEPSWTLPGSDGRVNRARVKG
ncbi:hypothetical protein OIV83_003949 [Microbotryomycetes sp. JL201]|nr:hypothetical protein OIV83_003949 [Microbotryomycetes sp. JL201]